MGFWFLSLLFSLVPRPLWSLFVGSRGSRTMAISKLVAGLTARIFLYLTLAQCAAAVYAEWFA